MPPPTIAALAPDRVRGRAPAATRAWRRRVEHLPAPTRQAELPPAIMAPAGTPTTAPLMVHLAEVLPAAAATAVPAEGRAAAPLVAHPPAEAHRMATPRAERPQAAALQVLAPPAVVRQPATPPKVAHQLAARQAAQAAAEIRPEVQLLGETPAPAETARAKGVLSAAVAIRARAAKVMARARTRR